MTKDAKDPKHKADGLRQPQRKDSLSSVLSWAALQGKITVSKTPTASSTPPSPQTPPGNSIRPRRHSHSTTETKTKARRGSTTFRSFSFSISTTIQDGASTKTRHAKTMTPDSKAAPGSQKTAKNGSSEKVNKPADTPGSKLSIPARPQSAQDKPRSASSPIPIPMPKSILRVSSPDGHRPARQFVSPETGEPSSPGQPSSCPAFGTIPPSSPSGSPPASPIQRPMSPSATVRFAKATIHRVEVGPGRRFLPVKRKSKSTLTYISPLDPGTQKSAPKTMLQSPTKMRRHQENQAAMGRYWLRTEEEEAQWRADAERRAEEEAERYRNEPASPPPPRGQAVDEVVGAAIDKLPLLDGGGGLGRVEEGVESEDEEEEAGARCNQGETTLKSTAVARSSDGESTGVEVQAGEVTEPKKQDAQQAPVTGLVEAQAASTTSKQSKGEASGSNTAASATTSQEPAKPTAAAPPPTTQDTKLAESKSFFERLAEKQAAEQRANRAPSPTTPKPESRNTPTTDKPARSPSTTQPKEKSAASSSGRSSSTSTNSTSSSNSSNPSAEQLAKTKEKEKENSNSNSSNNKDKAKEKTTTRTTAVSTVRSNMNLRSSGGGSSSSRADRTFTSTTTASRGNTSNHLHLSGRRGRRYWEEQKLGIMT